MFWVLCFGLWLWSIFFPSLELLFPHCRHLSLVSLGGVEERSVSRSKFGDQNLGIKFGRSGFSRGSNWKSPDPHYPDRFFFVLVVFFSCGFLFSLSLSLKFLEYSKSLFLFPFPFPFFSLSPFFFLLYFSLLLFSLSFLLSRQLFHFLSWKKSKKIIGLQKGLF